MKRYYFILILAFIGIYPLSYSPFCSQSFTKQDFHKADSSQIEVYWTSNDFPDPIPLSNNSVCTGDHIILSTTLEDTVNNETITSCNATLSRGEVDSYYFTPPIPSADYNPFFTSYINLTEFEWIYVEGIEAGDIVNISGICYETDVDFLVWWNDTATTTWSYFNNLIGAEMATASPIEQTAFLSDRAETLVIGCFNFGRSEVNVSLTIDTRYLHAFSSESNELVIDTYSAFEFNTTTNLEITGYTDSNYTVRYYYEDIQFNNFFAPQITTISIETEGYVHFISWHIFDLNQEDTHSFEVFVSSDDGESFQLIAVDLTETNYIWNSTSFLEDEYIVMVRVIDNTGLHSQVISFPFIGGGSHVTIDIGINHPEDLSFVEGSEGAQIVWIPECEFTLSYQIQLDDEVITEGTWTISSLIVRLDGLPKGEYLFVIILRYDAYNEVSDSVLVKVLSASTSTTESPSVNSSTTSSPTTSTSTTTTGVPDDISLIHILAISITIFSAGIIAIFTVLIIRWRIERTN
jgi:hypothetical protein